MTGACRGSLSGSCRLGWGRLAIVISITSAIAGPLRGQSLSGDALRTRIRAYRSTHDTSIVRELRDFVAIPNVASDTANIRRNAERLREMMAARGIAAKILDSPAGGSPAVYGELSTPGAMLGDWRLYGRSSSDDKAPIVAMLAAVDALKAAGARPSVNLKLFFE